ncbi:hypothetical protein H7T43_20330 [Peribacillus simplex]|nr:hypothetical protein [Peribacillus simplex]
METFKKHRKEDGFGYHSCSAPAIQYIYSRSRTVCAGSGFFDGVHLGHQELINLAKRIAKQQNLKLAVMTFFPHPKQIIGNDQTPQTYITPLEQKAKLIQDLGVDT